MQDGLRQAHHAAISPRRWGPSGDDQEERGISTHVHPRSFDPVSDSLRDTCPRFFRRRCRWSCSSSSSSESFNEWRAQMGRHGSAWPLRSWWQIVIIRQAGRPQAGAHSCSSHSEGSGGFRTCCPIMWTRHVNAIWIYKHDPSRCGALPNVHAAARYRSASAALRERPARIAGGHHRLTAYGAPDRGAGRASARRGGDLPHVMAPRARAIQRSRPSLMVCARGSRHRCPSPSAPSAIPIITLAGSRSCPRRTSGAMVGRQTPLLALICR
jgi:hypothetical protein